MAKRKVILVTDGDRVARKAVEIAASNIGGRCISATAGNPTLLPGEKIAELIKKADHDPVIVMVDDKGARGEGSGEKAMEAVAKDSDIDILGVVAVSSNGKDCSGLELSCSITKDGEVVEGGVDKYGNNMDSSRICGDTLSILENMRNLVIVGIGDPGKMDYSDETSKGAPITTRALEEVMKRSRR